VAKALLINPSYFRTYGSNEGGLAFPVYPILSLSAVGGALKARGHQITILDLSYREYDPRTIRELIVREGFDAVGITATTPLANQMRDISFLVKDISPDILTVGGGAHPSALPRETMNESCLDAVAAGEGDFSLADLLDGKNFADVPGLYWRRDGAIQASVPGGLIENLDDLPMPAWEDYPSECHKRVTRLIARYRPVTTIEFSRGCVFKCDFCGSKNTMGLGYRKKSPERCADELARLQALGYREVVLVDDIFTSDNHWAAKVCEAIIRRGLKIAWTCTNGIRVDSANPELFALMKRAGCYRVYFGFESGNDEVIRAFGKGGRATLEKGVKAVEMARKVGLEPNGFFMVGLTGDTEASMQDTIDYAKRVALDTMKCGITTPLPGTPMFDALRRSGRIKTLDWDQYTVYNKAEALYDHATLDWDTIKRYFDKFYVEAYFKNPRYMWRRFVFMLRNHEIFWNVLYAARFWLVMRGTGKPPERERYEFEQVWRRLDTRIDAPLGVYPVPVALSGRSRRIALAFETPIGRSINRRDTALTIPKVSRHIRS
jgi:anaerobic magnesium-protoporphyrin IX monomethyl ester cyclase